PFYTLPLFMWLGHQQPWPDGIADQQTFAGQPQAVADAQAFPFGDRTLAVEYAADPGGCCGDWSRGRRARSAPADTFSGVGALSAEDDCLREFSDKTRRLAGNDDRG
ncbi:MAG: hypothetical protein EA424_16920, partial [Planctomycetaceae bacterium]